MLSVDGVLGVVARCSKCGDEGVSTPNRVVTNGDTVICCSECGVPICILIREEKNLNIVAGAIALARELGKSVFEMMHEVANAAKRGKGHEKFVELMRKAAQARGHSVKGKSKERINPNEDGGALF